jgi:NADH-quinone oxidoreductase subunit E
MSPAVESILEKYKNAKRDQLIPLLQDVQESEGFLSREAVARIGRHLRLPASKIYGVATFYNQFRFQSNGKYHIQVCRGTACHVKGSAKVLDALKRELRIESGTATKDGLFSLEVVACIGACGLAPVISINGEFHANMTPDGTRKLLRTIRREEDKNDAAN